MKYSTGRGTRTKHSTAMEWNDLEKKIKKRSRLKHSTGDNAAIKHACGVELDLKAEDMDDAIEAKKQEIREKELQEKQRLSKRSKETVDDFEKSFKKVNFDY